VTLLGVRWSPSAVRRLLGEDTARHCLLVGISTATSLWEASDNRLAAIDPLWDLPTRDSDGMGQAQAGKLQARKRSRLVPVTGEIIVARVGPVWQTWRALRYCLQGESQRQAIGALRPRQARTASVLRLLDVALWMLHSQATAARNARAAASVTPQR
jgi:hypothetical protein